MFLRNHLLQGEYSVLVSPDTRFSQLTKALHVMKQPKAGHYITSSSSSIGHGCTGGRGLGVEGEKGKDKLKVINGI